MEGEILGSCSQSTQHFISMSLPEVCLLMEKLHNISVQTSDELSIGFLQDRVASLFIDSRHLHGGGRNGGEGGEERGEVDDTEVGIIVH